MAGGYKDGSLGTVVVCPTYKDSYSRNRRDMSMFEVLKTVPVGTVVIYLTYLQNCHRVFYNDGYF